MACKGIWMAEVESCFLCNLQHKQKKNPFAKTLFTFFSFFFFLGWGEGGGRSSPSLTTINMTQDSCTENLNDCGDVLVSAVGFGSKVNGSSTGAFQLATIFPV